MEPNLRRCVVCRQIAPKQIFWRIVRVYPSQTVQLDQGMGRSVYLCQNHDCLAIAKRKNSLGRSLKKEIPPEIHQTLEARLKAQIL
ncbi:MAG: YlxR family protein [Limnothrix sp. RL_2_0]|nr:YlxR family protein [Limnothrix sp. RL_2_0]